MLIEEKLTPNRKKFLEELGITKTEEIPNSFFEPIESYIDSFTKEERFCLSDQNISFCKQGLVSIKDIVGTNNKQYANKTWLEAFLELERGEELIEEYFNNSSYEENLKNREKVAIGLVYKNGKYFLYDRAGGGDNKLILMKLKYLALVAKENTALASLEEKFSFYANIRKAPEEEIARRIYYFIYPSGSFEESGYYVLNISSDSTQPLYRIVTNYPRRTNIVCDKVTEQDLLQITEKRNNRKK